jgi:acyl carrier protein
MPSVLPLTELIATVLDVDAALVTAATVREDVEAWDSLAQLGVVSALEETYAVILSSADMKRCVSIAEIRSVLSGLGVEA